MLPGIEDIVIGKYGNYGRFGNTMAIYILETTTSFFMIFAGKGSKTFGN